jgi:hypothetical protein
MLNYVAAAQILFCIGLGAFVGFLVTTFCIQLCAKRPERWFDWTNFRQMLLDIKDEWYREFGSTSLVLSDWKNRWVFLVKRRNRPDNLRRASLDGLFLATRITFGAFVACLILLIIAISRIPPDR